jgi:hypothetical protein
MSAQPNHQLFAMTLRYGSGVVNMTASWVVPSHPRGSEEVGRASGGRQGWWWKALADLPVVPASSSSFLRGSGSTRKLIKGGELSAGRNRGGHRLKNVYHRGNWVKIALISVVLIGLVALGIGYQMQTVPSASKTTLLSTSQTAVPSISQTTSSSVSKTTIPSSSQTVTYVTQSPPTSQWLVLSFSQLPLSVTANNTGLIPRFLSSESLNATRIGAYCEQSVTSKSASGQGSNSPLGACGQFITYQQTGWYWDIQNELLYIHYLGGHDVQISVVVGESDSS